jgi:hypothetical protein
VKGPDGFLKISSNKKDFIKMVRANKHFVTCQVSAKFVKTFAATDAA